MRKPKRKDLETRMKRGRTLDGESLAIVDVISNSRRGNEFLRGWIDPDDRPARDDDGRLYLILSDTSARKLLADAVSAGLEF